jgi:lysozyme family protein
MADITKLSPLILKWEGGYVNDPLDKGGCTNMGVTLAAYQKHIDAKGTCADVKAMTKEDFEIVLREYWNRWKADQINNQSIANILVDWVWGSGVWGIKKPQKILGVVADGQVGDKTIAAVNAYDPQKLFAIIYVSRLQFLDNIVKNNPSQERFIKGWKNRLADFKYSP